jgi:general secretion pathway protein D
VALFALSFGLLAACNQFPSTANQEVTKGPDIMDRVRSLDLQPRYPQQTGSTSASSGAAAKAQVYNGVTLAPVEGARSQPTAGGEGYELNFENTPIASVAKVVLGDILGTGYTIDPRVQGMISLASGRPVSSSCSRMRCA